MISYPNVKLNLGLNVLRKRPDGFHDLETLFIPYYGYSDILEIVPDAALSSSGDAAGQGPSAAKKRGNASESPCPAAGNRRTGTEGSCPAADSIEIKGGTWDPQTDLCWRALQLLKQDFDISPVHISLTKRSPVGAGLGSGSSDAAFTLKMLNSMFSLGLSDESLAEYAARLGSDCAFFIYNRPMLGEGRGEILTPYDLDLAGYGIKVEIPEGVSVSTREAYSGIRPRNPDTSSGDISLREALSLPVEEWRGRLVNDFETTVFALHPEIKALKDAMYDRGAVYAAMSGSGSSVFGIFKK